MSTESLSNTTLKMPYPIRFANSLSKTEQITITSLLQLLPTAISDNLMSDSIVIKAMVDGRGLACPMPLLKTKVALRDVGAGEALYVVATDPNSQADIQAFCQQTQKGMGANPLLLMVNQMTQGLSDSDGSGRPADTIFHFIITKTDSN